jgi:hypothetical protein
VIDEHFEAYREETMEHMRSGEYQMIDEDFKVESVIDQQQLDSDGSSKAPTAPVHIPQEKREWFIRSMPSDIIEQVRTAAKVARMTVAEWLSEKLRHILAGETGVLDDSARITKLEKEVEDAHQRIDNLCELVNAEREAKARAERGRTPDELRERMRQFNEERRQIWPSPRRPSKDKP